MAVAKMMTHRLLWGLLFVYFSLFPFGQLTRLPVGFDNLSLYLTDVIVGFCGLVWMAGVIRGVGVLPRLFVSWMVLVAAFAFSLLAAAYLFTFPQLAVSSLYLIRFSAYFLLYGAVVTITQVRGRTLVLQSLIVVGVSVALFGWWQYFLYPDIRPLLVWGWDEHLYRIVGTFLDPQFTALILVFTYFEILMFRLSTRVKLILLLVVFSALLFTYSRAGYVALVVGLVVLWRLSGRAIVLVGIGLLVIVLPFLPRPAGEGVRLERTASIVARLDNWHQAYSLFSKRPLFGYGFNTVRYVKEHQGLVGQDTTSHAVAGFDNSLLFVLVTAGIVGGLAFVWWIVALVIAAWRGSDWAFVASLAAVCVHALFVNSFFYPWVLGWLAIRAGSGQSVDG